MKYKTNLAQRLRAKRMSQRGLAEMLGTSQSRTSAYSLGKEKPGATRIEQMRIILGKSLYFKRIERHAPADTQS